MIRASGAGSSAADEDLTIVLTLKDRHAYTARWMAFANSAGFPFKVLIADGSAGNDTARLLADKALFPRVDFEYVRYPPDNTYADYYVKMADALGRVRTTFVAMADNDDFFVVDSLRKSIRFLAAHRDYVSCGGYGAIFWLRSSMLPGPDARVPGRHLDWKCTRMGGSIEGETARARIRTVSLSKSDTFYYDVKRTGEARKQMCRVRDLNLHDLFLVEHLVWYLAAIAGKTMRHDCLYMARQQDSPGSSGGEHALQFGDWFGRMLLPSWSQDFAKFLDAVSGELASADGIGIDEARRAVLSSYRASVAPSLLSDLMHESTVSAPMPAVVRAIRRLVDLPERSVIRRVARAIYRRADWISLDVVYGTEFLTTPVANARSDFEPIREFLEQESCASGRTGELRG